MKRIEDKFCSIADSIRKRKGSTDPIQCCDFEKEIMSIGDGTVEVIPDGYEHVAGTKSINSNGKHDITNYKYVEVNVPVGDTIPEGSLVPEGTKVVTANGEYDIKEYASLTVNVPTPEGYILPTGTKIVTSNGTYEIKEYDKVTVNVPIPDGYILPAGTKVISANGTHYVDQYSMVQVNVPIPTGYIIPSGTKSITSNGIHDVKDYANVNINVNTGVPEGYIKPEGTSYVTKNGEYDVTDDKKVIVEVPSGVKTEQEKTVTPSKEYQYITANDPTTQALSKVTVNPIPSEYIVPEGKLEITQNGQHIVKNYEYVQVNVQGETVQAVTVQGTKNFSITENNMDIYPDENYDAMAHVRVSFDPTKIGPRPTGNIKVTEVGTHDIQNYATVTVEHTDRLDVTSNGVHNVANYGSVNVNVPSEACDVVYKNTVVPNTGTIEKLYFNGNLSVEEVVSILSTLTYIETPFLQYPLYPILFSSDGTPVVFAVKDNSNYEINIAYDLANQVFDRIFLSYDSNDGNKAGFHKTECEINKSVISEYSGLPIGFENSKLSGLVSVEKILNGEDITLGGEFKARHLHITENGEIDLKSTYFDNKEMPTKINVNIPNNGIKLTPTIISQYGGWKYKFMGIYTGGTLNQNMTYNEELTNMVKELASYLDIDTTDYHIMNSSYTTLRDYDINDDTWTFDYLGLHRGQEQMGDTIYGWRIALYIPPIMISEMLSGKYSCIQARFEIVERPTSDAITCCYMATDDTYNGWVLKGYQNDSVYTPITTKNEVHIIDENIFATQLLYSD